MSNCKAYGLSLDRLAWTIRYRFSTFRKHYSPRTEDILRIYTWGRHRFLGPVVRLPQNCKYDNGIFCEW